MWQGRHHLVSLHYVREAHSSGIIKPVWIDRKWNPEDILTKFRSSREWYPLMKPLILWSSSEGAYDGRKGIEEDMIKLANSQCWSIKTEVSINVLSDLMTH